MSFVIRIVGSPKGHSFFECMEDGSPLTQKVKYATEYDTKELAEKEIEDLKLTGFEVVSMSKAEYEYYSN